MDFVQTFMIPSRPSVFFNKPCPLGGGLDDYRLSILKHASVICLYNGKVNVGSVQ